MRLTVVSAYYPSHGGGMELACKRLVEDLAAGGHEVRWMAQTDGVLPDVPHAECCPFEGSDLVYRLSGIPLPLPYPQSLLSLIKHLKWSDQVIITEANFIISALAFVVAKLLGIRTIVVQHVGQPSTVSRIATALAAIAEVVAVRPMLKSADRVVFVSPWVAAHFGNLKLDHRAAIIGHAIDTDVFRPASSSSEERAARCKLGLPPGPIGCFVGRLTETKGIGIIEEMARRRPDLTFAIAGSGPINPDDWGLDNVRYLGQLSADRVALLYQASEVFLLPSQSESFSLVVREALACGCAVICSAQILETDHRLTDFVATTRVDLTDSAGTAKRFLTLFEKAQGHKADAARRHVLRECSPHEVRRRYLELVDQISPRTIMTVSP
jgi:glycosyltransferase involved in cell wall biosynthesis